MKEQSKSKNFIRQNKTLSELCDFFTKPTHSKQRQYEAVRAIVLENMSIAEAAKKFGYTKNSMESLIRDVKNGKIDLFPIPERKAQKVKIEGVVLETVINLRKKNKSVSDIHTALRDKNVMVSERTIERALKNNGFGRRCCMNSYSQI